ncbi:hypothetical protein G3I51_32620, partial [Streptomyces sp. SID9944]|nr:hypothetical protein [Streptomyces sp. SID9944]
MRKTARTTLTGAAVLAALALPALTGCSGTDRGEGAPRPSGTDGPGGA